LADVHEVEGRVDERLQREGGVQGRIKGGDAAGEQAAHGESPGEPLGMKLDEAGRDQPAHRLSPCNGPPGRRDLGPEQVEDVDLVLECLLHGPIDPGVGRSGERIAVGEEPIVRDRIAGRFEQIGAARGRIDGRIRVE
jgi:hypothetical protein